MHGSAWTAGPCARALSEYPSTHRVGHRRVASPRRAARRPRPQLKIGAGGRTRTDTGFYTPRILSPVRLPFRHTGNHLPTEACDDTRKQWNASASLFVPLSRHERRCNRSQWSTTHESSRHDFRKSTEWEQAGDSRTLEARRTASVRVISMTRSIAWPM